jgi:hypothetical protein
MAQNGLAIPPPNVRFRENGGRSRRAGSTRTFDGLGLCRKSAYVPVEHIGGRIDMKRHGFSRLSGGGLAQYRALIAEWQDGKCWSAVSAD